MLASRLILSRSTLTINTKKFIFVDFKFTIIIRRIFFIKLSTIIDNFDWSGIFLPLIEFLSPFQHRNKNRISRNSFVSSLKFDFRLIIFILFEILSQINGISHFINSRNASRHHNNHINFRIFQF